MAGKTSKRGTRRRAIGVIPAHTRFNWGMAMASGATIAVLYVLALRQMLVNYRLHGDDFALVLHSSRGITAGDVVRWFVDGYTDYFLNYPDWQSTGFAFVRPVANAVFLISGWAEPLIGERAYLLGSYLVPIVTVVVVAAMIQRYTILSARMAAG